MTEFYSSYIGFHPFNVVFLRTGMTMMFLLNTSTGLCFAFQNIENNVKIDTCVYFVASFLGKNTILDNSIKVQVQYN